MTIRNSVLVVFFFLILSAKLSGVKPLLPNLKIIMIFCVLIFLAVIATGKQIVIYIL